MEINSTKHSLFEYIKTIGIVIIAVCSIIIVIQGKRKGTQDVYVNGGRISADVSGNVSVGNTVDVNLDKVLGYSVGCHKSYTINGREYQAIDVTIR